MADNAPRAALAQQSRSDLAALVADAWQDRGWSIAGGDPNGADVVATRESAYAERLAIVVAEPGATIDAATVQRAAGIRQQEQADVALVVGTDDVDDVATELARREALNVKVLDGWALCRVLDEQGLLGRIGDGGGSAIEDGPTSGGSGQGAVGSSSQSDAATAVDDGEPGPTAAGDTAAGDQAVGDDEDGKEATAASAADNETPCPSCGEPIFRPLIEQGLQCPYCDADFE